MCEYKVNYILGLFCQMLCDAFSVCVVVSCAYAFLLTASPLDSSLLWKGSRMRKSSLLVMASYTVRPMWPRYWILLEVIMVIDGTCNWAPWVLRLNHKVSEEFRPPRCMACYNVGLPACGHALMPVNLIPTFGLNSSIACGWLWRV